MKGRMSMADSFPKQEEPLTETMERRYRPGSQWSSIPVVLCKGT